MTAYTGSRMYSILMTEDEIRHLLTQFKDVAKEHKDWKEIWDSCLMCKMTIQKLKRMIKRKPTQIKDKDIKKFDKELRSSSQTIDGTMDSVKQVNVDAVKLTEKALNLCKQL